MSVQPGLEFSTTSHNFGVCFLSQPDMPVPSMLLTLTNTDNKDIRFVNCDQIYCCRKVAAVWHSGDIIGHINEVTLFQVRLVLGWY